MRGVSAAPASRAPARGPEKRLPGLSIVAAVASNGVIGARGRLPWRLPDDLKRFKALTMGKPIVMGRRTWDSLGRALHGRHNIVVSRGTGIAAAGATLVSSLPAAFRAAGDVDEVCVIGGGEIYRLVLPVADVIHLTRVHAVVDADTFFPSLDGAEWEEVRREDRPADERHAHHYSFIELVRRPRPRRATRERSGIGREQLDV